MNRQEAAALAKDTLRILEVGEYELGGRVVSIQDAFWAAVKGTVEYPPDKPVADPLARHVVTMFEVSRETTLEAARRLADTGRVPVALNFASAKNPGGGFIRGALAQEESLARSSGLYACIQHSPMYAYHRRLDNPMYTDYCIYSPGVPVFRDDAGRLVEPYSCAFLTCAAVNAGVISSSYAWRIRSEMESRVERVLAIAASYGHEDVVLGAWGCGVFQNDPEVVSKLFKEALAGDFAGAFRRVIFAIPDGKNAGPFERDFGI